MSIGKSQLKCLSACPSCVVSYTGFLVAPLSTFLIMPVVMPLNSVLLSLLLLLLLLLLLSCSILREVLNCFANCCQRCCLMLHWSAWPPFGPTYIRQCPCSVEQEPAALFKMF